MNRLCGNGRFAVVVGASSGIGFEVAELLIADGWTICIAARRRDLLLKLKALCPDRVEVVQLDVTSDSSADALSEILRRHGHIDLFFYLSGIGKQNLSLQSDIEMDTVVTNALGFTRMVGVAYRFMADHGGGHIAAVSSIAGTRGLGASPAYSATKAFQNCYLQALEQQARTRRLNISFTDIRPGFVDTPLLSSSSRYPLMMSSAYAARLMLKAVYRRRHVVVIDWRWRMVVTLWRMIPSWLWRNLRISAG